jgi:FixJ family two-component response regulator
MGRLRIEDLEADLFKVASLVADGASNQEVASQLGLPLGTVKNRMGAIFRELNISSRADLIVGVWGSNGPPVKRPLEFKNGVLQLPKGSANVAL